MNNIHHHILLLLMAIVLTFPSLQAQESEKKLLVKGVVEDALGPIVGASVVAKNQPGVGTITDLDGQFSIKVGPYDVLQITFVGYKDIEVPVLSIKDRNHLTVKMLEDNQAIEEVVVTASGVQNPDGCHHQCRTQTFKCPWCQPKQLAGRCSARCHCHANQR